MKIAIANDHAAYELKKDIQKYLEDMNIVVENCGTDDTKSVDYPVFAYKACKKVIDGEVNLAILICGTGIGMSIAANKIKGIRAALCHDEFSARMTRKHNNANVLCLGARVTGVELAKSIVKNFIENEQDKDERHLKRLKMLKEIEDNGTL